MRLIEIISEEEWGRLQQLVFDAAWRALSTYQQQRATQMRMASKPIAKFKPQVANKAKALAVKPSSYPTQQHPSSCQSLCSNPSQKHLHLKHIAQSKPPRHCHPQHTKHWLVFNLVQLKQTPKLCSK
jgi:hypothetical protein